MHQLGISDYIESNEGMFGSLMIVPIGVTFLVVSFTKHNWLAPYFLIYFVFVLPICIVIGMKIYARFIKMPKELLRTDRDTREMALFVFGLSAFFLPAFVIVIPAMIWIWAVSATLTVYFYEKGAQMP